MADRYLFSPPYRRQSAMSHEQLDRIETKLDRLTFLIRQAITWEKAMSAELDRLTAAVAAEGDVVKSTETMIAGLVQQVKDLATNGGTPQQFTDLATQIESYTQRLSAAGVQNTPAASLAKKPAAAQAPPKKP